MTFMEKQWEDVLAHSAPTFRIAAANSVLYLWRVAVCNSPSSTMGEPFFGFALISFLQTRCCSGLHHARASLGASVFRADRDDHLIAHRNPVKPFCAVFAYLHHSATATGADNLSGSITCSTRGNADIECIMPVAGCPHRFVKPFATCTR